MSSDMWPNKYEKIAEVFFEYHQCPALFLCQPPVLALYSYGLTTGMVVDSGHHETLLVPVFEGYSIKPCMRRVPIAGNAITKYFATILTDTYDLNANPWVYNDDILSDIKEKYFYTAMDYETELNNFSSKDKVRYELPDGGNISIGSEILRCPEVMFQPELIGKNFDPIHIELNNCIQKCDIDIKRDLYRNICFSGGNSMFKMLHARFTNEIENLTSHKINIRDDKEIDGQSRSWVGGAILTS